MRKAAAWILLPAVWGWAVLAAPAAAAQLDLTKLSLEELIRLEVTTVSRKKQPFFEAGAAVYVVTRDDIRRSGATSIPEALRGVPGVQVGADWCQQVGG